MKKIIFDVIKNKIDKGKEIDLRGEDLTIERINKNPIDFLNKDFFTDNFQEADFIIIKKLFIFLKRGYFLRLTNFYFQRTVRLKKAEKQYKLNLQKAIQRYNEKKHNAKKRMLETWNKIINNWQPKNQQEQLAKQLIIQGNFEAIQLQQLVRLNDKVANIVSKRQEIIATYQEKIQEAEQYLQEKKQDYLQRYNEKRQEILEELKQPDFLQDLEENYENIDDITYLLNTNFGKLFDKFEKNNEEDNEDEIETRTVFKKIVFQLLFIDSMVNNNIALNNSFLEYIRNKITDALGGDIELLKDVLDKLFRPFRKDIINIRINSKNVFTNLLNFAFNQVNNSQFLDFALNNIKFEYQKYYQEDALNNIVGDETIITKIVGYMSLVLYWTNFWQEYLDGIESFKEKVGDIINNVLIRNNKLYIKTIDEEYKYKKFTEEDLKAMKVFLQQIYLLTVFSYLITTSVAKELIINKDEKLNIIIGEGEEGKILTLLSFLAKFNPEQTIEKKAIINLTSNMAKKILEGEKIIIVYNKVFVDFLFIFYFVNIITQLIKDFGYSSSEYLIFENSLVLGVEGTTQRIYALKFNREQIKSIYKITDNYIIYPIKYSRELLGLTKEENNENNKDKDGKKTSKYIDMFKIRIKFKNIRYDPKIYKYKIKLDFNKIISRYRNFNKPIKDAYSRAFLEIARGFSYNNGILTAIETPLFYKLHKHLLPIIFIDNIENPQIDENIIIGASKKILYHRVGFHTPFIIIFNKYIPRSKTFNLQILFFNFNVKMKVGRGYLHLRPIDFNVFKKYISGEKITKLTKDLSLKQYNIESSFNKIFKNFLVDNDYPLVDEKRVKKTIISKRLEIQSKTAELEGGSLDYIKLDYFLYGQEILSRYDEFRDKTIKFFDNLMKSFFQTIPYVMDFEIFKKVYKAFFPKARIYAFVEDELKWIKESKGDYNALPIEFKNSLSNIISILKIDVVGQNLFKNIINPYLFRIDLDQIPIESLTEEDLFIAVYRLLKLVSIEDYLILQYDTYINIFIALYKQKFKKENGEEYTDQEIIKIVIQNYIRFYSKRYLLFTNTLQRYYKVDKIVHIK